MGGEIQLSESESDYVSGVLSSKKEGTIFIMMYLNIKSSILKALEVPHYNGLRLEDIFYLKFES